MAIVPAGLLSACSTPPAKEPDAAPGQNLLDGAVVYSNFVTLNREYYVQWHEGAKRAVEALGGVYKFATDDQDPARQISQFQQQAAGGNKIFFNAGPDPSSLAPIAKLAAEKKAHFTHFFEIPTWGSVYDPRLNPSSYFVSFFIPDFETIGEMMVDELARAIDEDGLIAHVSGFPGSTPDLQVSKGIDKGLKKYPGIKLGARVPGNFLQDDSRDAMAGMIRQLGGANINGVLGTNDDCAIGAIQALEESKLNDIPVVGNNGSTLAAQYVVAGRMHATVANFPAWNAGTAAVRAIDAHLGWKPTVPERMQLPGGTLITADNAPGYLDYVTGPDPFDWVRMSRVASPDNWDPQGPIKGLRYDQFWSGFDNPDKFKIPAEMKAAEDSGEYDKIDALYDAHYKQGIFGDKR
jgi:ribose transport system substrate-binding protein